MKTYTVTEFEGQKVISYMEGNRKISFTENADSKNYQEYLRYTEWVEAGNNPEDFWTRDLDSPEGLEQVSEPKEEKEETPQEGEG